MPVRRLPPRHSKNGKGCKHSGRAERAGLGEVVRRSAVGLRELQIERHVEEIAGYREDKRLGGKAFIGAQRLLVDRVPKQQEPHCAPHLGAPRPEQRLPFETPQQTLQFGLAARDDRPALVEQGQDIARRPA